MNHGNLAFIDGQNLYLGTKTADTSWQVDLKRFRIYLREKFNIKTAYFFLGYTMDENEGLYDAIQKGKVDTGIVFNIMKRLYLQEDFEKILFSNFKRASSLYKKLSHKFFVNLSQDSVKNKIGKKKGALGN